MNRVCRWGHMALLLVNVLAVTSSASARILKTRQTGQFKAFALTIGSGFEFETDDEQTEYGFPFLLEYGVTEALTLTVEPSYVSIRPKGGGSSISGFGDLETGATFEFLRERRNRPSLSFEGIVKWPTASKDEIGTGEYDFSLGAIASKEFIHSNLDFNFVYTMTGDPPDVDLQDIIEISLAGEWHLSRTFDLEGEIVTSAGAGSNAKSGSVGGFGSPGGRETEATLGISELLSDQLKLEQGFIAKFDGSWQIVAAWEWDFAGGE